MTFFPASTAVDAAKQAAIAAYTDAKRIGEALMTDSESEPTVRTVKLSAFTKLKGLYEQYCAQTVSAAEVDTKLEELNTLSEALFTRPAPEAIGPSPST